MLRYFCVIDNVGDDEGLGNVFGVVGEVYGYATYALAVEAAHEIAERVGVEITVIQRRYVVRVEVDYTIFPVND